MAVSLPTFRVGLMVVVISALRTWMLMKVPLAGAAMTCFPNDSPPQTICIDKAPMDVTLLLGTVAAFHCTSLIGRIVWFVNGLTYFDFHTKYNARFLTKPRSDGQIGQNSTLYILGTEYVNNSNISCVVINEFNFIADNSSAASLLVQGAPLPPTDLSIYFKDRFIQLQWSPPFTLFSRQEQTPMLQYVVYAFTNQSTWYYRQETNSTSTYMILLNELRFQLCNLSVTLMSFGVSAMFDEVGEGEISDYSVIIFNKQTVESVCQEDDTGSVTVENGGGNQFLEYLIKYMLGILSGLFLMLMTALVVSIPCVMYRKQNVIRNTEECDDCHTSINENPAYGLYKRKRIIQPDNVLENKCNQDNFPVNSVDDVEVCWPNQAYETTLSQGRNKQIIYEEIC